MTRYAQALTNTLQSEQADVRQVKNSAGGYTFQKANNVRKNDAEYLRYLCEKVIANPKRDLFYQKAMEQLDKCQNRSDGTVTEETWRAARDLLKARNAFIEAAKDFLIARVL